MFAELLTAMLPRRTAEREKSLARAWSLVKTRHLRTTIFGIFGLPNLVTIRHHIGPTPLLFSVIPIKVSIRT